MVDNVVTIEGIAHIASEGIRAIATHVGSSNTIQDDNDGNLVTKADLASNIAITQKAKTLYPSIPIHSEESCLEGWEGEKELLVVDPLDGTTNYLYGMQPSSVSIAYVKNGSPELGVVAPLSGGIHFGIKGNGSYYSHSIDTLEYPNRLRCSNRPIGRAVLNVTTDQSNENSRRVWWKLLSRFKPPTCFRLRIIESAAMELCWVASGLIDGYIHPSDKPWDVAAGVLIASEAGAITMNLKCGEWRLQQEGTVVVTRTIETDVRKILNYSISNSD